MQLLVPIIAQRRELFVDAEDHIAASSSIAAVRTAAWNVRLPPERDHSFAAVTTTYQHRRASKEHLDPRERSHECADAQMRELLPQSLQRASDTDARLPTLNGRERAQRIGGEITKEDRAPLRQLAPETHERRDLFSAIEDAREHRNQETRGEALFGSDADRRANVGKAIALRSVQRLVHVRAGRRKADRDCLEA